MSEMIWATNLPGHLGHYNQEKPFDIDKDTPQKLGYRRVQKLRIYAIPKSRLLFR